MGLLTAKHCRHLRRLPFADYEFQMSRDFILKGQDNQPPRKTPLSRNVNAAHMGGPDSAVRPGLCPGVLVCLSECFCVTSQSPLMKHKGPVAFSCRGQVLCRADFGFTVALFSLQAPSFIYRSDSARPSLCASRPFLLHFFRACVCECKLIWTLSSSSSVWWSVCPTATQCAAAPPFFPDVLEFYPPFLPSPSTSAAHLVCLDRSSRRSSEGSFQTCHPPSCSSHTLSQWCRLLSKRSSC